MKYFKQNNTWYYKDKNNKNRKVTSVKKLDELNNSVDLNNSKPEKTIDGVGDVISSITSFLGIKECEGCEDRKNKLNQLFPFLKPNLDNINEEDILLMDRVNKSTLVKSDDVDRLYSFYNRLFNKNKRRQNCPGCVRTIIEQINKKINI